MELFLLLCPYHQVGHVFRWSHFGWLCFGLVDYVLVGHSLIGFILVGHVVLVDHVLIGHILVGYVLVGHVVLVMTITMITRSMIWFLHPYSQKKQVLQSPFNIAVRFHTFIVMMIHDHPSSRHISLVIRFWRGRERTIYL